MISSFALKIVVVCYVACCDFALPFLSTFSVLVAFANPAYPLLKREMLLYWHKREPHENGWIRKSRITNSFRGCPGTG
jgi:hypothetical protein